MSDSLDSRIHQGCALALRSPEMQAMFKQMAYDAASQSSRRQLEALGVGSLDPEENSRRIEAFRANHDFLTRMRERCEAFYSRAFTTIVTTTVAGAVGGAYLLLKHLFPGSNLP